MNINDDRIVLDSDGDEILEETAPKTVSFQGQENRIINLVANAVSAKTSLQIKKEIMTSQVSKTANLIYKVSTYNGFITVGKNKKPKQSTTTDIGDRWVNSMDDDTDEDKEVRVYVKAKVAHRK